MGYTLHHAIIVTSWKREAIEESATKARELGLQVLGPSEQVINGYSSFLVCPDGSKERWPDSDVGDAARESFKKWMLTTRYEDGSGSLEWAEVRFGSDDQSAEVSDHAWRVG